MRALRVLVLAVILTQPLRANDFVRGDCNADGARNIADAVRVLNYLFPPGQQAPIPPTCLDACDANDDGNVNLADPIFILGFLKPPGAPVPLPEPSTCGQDMTADSLDCLAFAPCP